MEIGLLVSFVKSRFSKRLQDKQRSSYYNNNEIINFNSLKFFSYNIV